MSSATTGAAAPTGDEPQQDNSRQHHADIPTTTTTTTTTTNAAVRNSSDEPSTAVVMNSSGNNHDSKSHHYPNSHSSPHHFLDADGNKLASVSKFSLLDEEEEVVGELGDFIPAPPDGGWGWVVVIASFMANFVVDGISYSFGVFMPEFQAWYGSPQGVTALVGSLLTGCYLLVGPIVSGLVNTFGSRNVMIAGSCLACFAFFISIWMPTISTLMITYGIMGGIGCGMIYLPAIVHVGYYFERKRALATGIAAAGSGAGTFVFAPLGVYLLENYGWQGSHFILAGFLLNCCVFGALLRPLKPKKDPGELEHKLHDESERLREKLSQLEHAEDNNSNWNVSVTEGGQEQQRRRTLSNSSSTAASRRNSSATQKSRAATSTGNAQELSSPLKSQRHSKDSQTSEPGADSVLMSPAPALSVLKEGELLKDEELLEEGQTTPGKLRGPSFVYNRNKDIMDGLKPNPDGVHSPPHGHRTPKRTHRLSARSFATSMQRLHTESVENAATSLQTLGSIRSVEFTKPLNRRDIFYTGSVVHLQPYKEARGNTGIYRQSIISIPQAMAHEGIEVHAGDQGRGHGLSPLGIVGHPDDYDDAGKHGICSWIPEPVKYILFEMVGIRLLKEPVMILLCLSNVFGMLGFYAPYVFLTAKAEKNLGVSATNASFLLSLMGITNTCGRVVFGWISDRQWVSALTINNFCLLVCSTLTLLLPLCNTYELLIVYSCIFGFMISAYISLTSIILVDYLGLDNLSNSFGLLILSRGISAMCGSPLAGLVYDSTNSYDKSFLFSGTMLMGATIVSFMVPAFYTCQYQFCGGVGAGSDDEESGGRRSSMFMPEGDPSQLQNHTAGLTNLKEEDENVQQEEEGL